MPLQIGSLTYTLPPSRNPGTFQYFPGDAPEDSDFTSLQVASLTSFGVVPATIVGAGIYTSVNEVDAAMVYESDDMYSAAVGDVFYDASDVLVDVAVDSTADIAEEVFFDALLFLLL
jgi:hypothetical protein